MSFVGRLMSFAENVFKTLGCPPTFILENQFNILFMKKINLVFITIFSLLFSLQVSAQEKSITGTVTTASDGVPLPGVSVVVDGTNRGTTTDFDGMYSLEASVGEILKVSFLGMKDVSVTVGDTNLINVAMEEDSQALDEVIVTALGIKKEKKAVTITSSKA